MEVYKDIKGYEGIYQISNYGNVKSLKFGKEKILSKGLSSTGYLIVRLSKCVKVKNFTIHQLVAVAFLNHKPDRYTIVIDHKDNNRLNNNVSNLQLITQRENASKDKTGYSSNYVGVFYHKPSKQWKSSIHINGIVKHLGYFKNEYDAHLAYQEKLNIIKNSLILKNK